MQHNNHPTDSIVNELYAAWRESEKNTSRIFEEAGEDYENPEYVEAEKQSKKALFDFLCQPTGSLFGVLLKLKVACHYEDYMVEALNPLCSLVAPRAIVAAINDLEIMLLQPREII